jgi:hypothetical protein
MPATTSSFTALALAPGALKTGIHAINRDIVDTSAGATNRLDGFGHLHFMHVERAQQDGVRVLDLGSHLVGITREVLETDR